MHKLKNIIKEILDEQNNLLTSNNEYLEKILKELGITNYNILGIGAHGIVVHNLEDGKAYKFTNSKSEIEVAKKLLNNNFKSLPVVYKVDTINGNDYWVRDVFNEISDDLSGMIGEELDEIAEFMHSRAKDVRKSETNLDFYFDAKFLDFLNQMKSDLIKLGIKTDFDIEGIPLNILTDKNGNYKLIDF